MRRKGRLLFELGTCEDIELTALGGALGEFALSARTQKDFEIISGFALDLIAS